MKSNYYLLLSLFLIYVNINCDNINKNTPSINPESPESLFIGKDVMLKYLDFGSDTVFVTFGGAINPANGEFERGPNTEGFGEKYFKKRKISALFVVNFKNNWYQTKEMEKVLPLIQERLKNYKKVITYGVSMGGFAALAFSKALNANSVLAFAPQIDFTKYPDFPTWYKESGGFTIKYTVENGLSNNSIIYVFYPKDYYPDRNAIETDLEKIKNDLGLSQYYSFPLPSKVHSIMGPLQKLGLLSVIIQDVEKDQPQKLKELFKEGSESWDKFKEIASE